MSNAVYSSMASSSSDENLEKAHNIAGHVEPHTSPSRRGLSSMTVRLKMFGLLILSAAFMVAHDQLYVRLRKRSLSSDLGVNQDDLQDVATHVGNAFAFITNFLLSAAIGLAFVQMFWMRMRSKAHTIAEIDAAMSLRTNSLGSWRAWRSMFLLALIPALALSNVHIVILGSGAMHVELAATSDVCDIFNVNLTNANFGVVTPDAGGTSLTYSNPEAQVKGFVTQIVMLSDVIPPKIIDDDVLRYPLSFHAPGLNCTDVTNSVDSSLILPAPLANDDPIPVWATVYQLGGAGDTLNFTTASRDLTSTGNDTFAAVNNEQTVHCTFYNVTYEILVNFTSNGAYDAPITKRTLNAPLAVGFTDDDTTNEVLEFDSLADTFARTLNGTAAYDPTIFDFTPESPIIVYSPFGESQPGVPWSLANADLTAALPDLMDAVSISLLSDLLNTAPDSKPVSRVQGKCLVQKLVFQYNRTRLLVSYGVGLLFTSICIAIGCYIIHKSGFEETMNFSRIMRSVVHPGLYNHRDDIIHKETLLQADKGEAGEFGVKLLKSA